MSLVSIPLHSRCFIQRERELLMVRTILILSSSAAILEKLWKRSQFGSQEPQQWVPHIGLLWSKTALLPSTAQKAQPPIGFWQLGGHSFPKWGGKNHLLIVQASIQSESAAFFNNPFSSLLPLPLLFNNSLRNLSSGETT